MLGFQRRKQTSLPYAVYVGISYIVAIVLMGYGSLVGWGGVGVGLIFSIRMARGMATASGPTVVCTFLLFHQSVLHIIKNIIKAITSHLVC